MSGGFRFALQALLDYRSSVEKAFRAEARVCAKTYAEAQAHLNLLGTQLRKCDQAADLRRRSLRAEYLLRAIGSQSRIVHDCEAALAAARARLRDALKDAKALERLKERRWKAYAEIRERAEEAELDDSNARRNSPP